MKLSELQIKHFGCIGDDGITVRIDDIIVLIGKNNVGKTTILRAYEAFSGTGAALSLDSFYRNDTSVPVEIVGVFTDISDEDKASIGEKWIYTSDGKDVVKCRWIWKDANVKGEKSSWDNESGEWKPKGVGGWDGIITSCIPMPLLISPFEDTAKMEKQIIDLLTESLNDKIDLLKVSQRVDEIVNEVKADVSKELNDTTNRLQDNLNAVFPGCSISVEPQVGRIDLNKVIADGTHLKISHGDENLYPLSCHGSGLQRAFLWSAIEALADSGKMKSGSRSTTIDSHRQKILLVEEPESFLHPPAVRAARDALYKIAELQNWQVMITTHSPVLVDVSKPHTTIVRVDGVQHGTKIFSTDEANFEEDDRARLRMIRSCHPTVNEFFFADRVILVEGDTEEAVFSEFAPVGVAILNCRGKANIPMFEGILNHFGVPYVVIHDLDRPKAIRKNSYVRNSAWSINMRILSEAKKSVGSHVIVNVPDFEGQYFGYLRNGDKPYNAICELRKAENASVLRELDSIINGDLEDIGNRLICVEEQYTQIGMEYCEKEGIEQSREWDFTG